MNDLCGSTGTETVIFTLTDECGNDIEMDATFTIEDTTDPTWTTPPSDMTVECDGTADPSGAFAAWLTSFSGTDVCGTATVTHNSTGLSDLCGATGTETVTFTLTDECGLDIEMDATFTIEDTNPPTGIQPTATTGVNACLTDAQTSVPSFNPTEVAMGYTDGCSTPLVTLTNTATSGDDCSWDVTYTYNVSDDCGNILGSQIQVHSGGDTDAPTGTCPIGDLSLIHI